MLFTTFGFWVFLGVVLAVYGRVTRRWRWVVLLVSSYWFYAWWNVGYVGLIMVTTLVNYGVGRRLDSVKRGKGWYLAGAVGFDLGMLALFKYFNFLSGSLAQLGANWGWQVAWPQLTWLLPVGISFYTFQSVAYLVDVYRGTIKAEKHLGYMALFTCFFPQLLAGPIERAGELLPQLKRLRGFDYGRMVSGMQLTAWGMFKKMVIADNLGVVVDRVFESLPEYKGLSLVLTAVLYSWQIYADFSGYTDMARGVARMLGINLVENFTAPYLATSVHDFWRRWHMSLSRWFKDYLYIPLGGSRKGLKRTMLNVVIVFTLCGLWHGASWTFVIWGAIHGVLMAGERLAAAVTRGRVVLPRVVQIGYTYTVVTIAWVFFRASDLDGAVYVISNAVVGVANVIRPAYVMATLNQLFLSNRVEMGLAIGVALTAVVIELISRRRLYVGLMRQPVWVRYVAYVTVVAAVVQLRIADIKEFIYIRF